MRHYEAKAEVRKHYYLEKYVAIAPKRTHSLHHTDYRKTGDLKAPPLEDESSIFEIPSDKGEWAVKVVRNLFPAFSLGNPQAYGAQEVLLETNPVDTPFAQLSIAQIARVLGAYQNRIAALRKIKDIKYVSVFHNNGLEAGASVRQTHSQLIAIGIEPPLLRQESEMYVQFKKRYGVSPIIRAIEWEEKQQQRLIYNDNKIVAFAPYASEHPYEAWLVPRREISSICALKPAELEAMAKALKAVVMALSSEQLPFNWHLVEPVSGRANHFMIRIAPRPNVWAGFELNTGIPINPVAPEDAADWYRNFCKVHNAL